MQIQSTNPVAVPSTEAAEGVQQKKQTSAKEKKVQGEDQVLFSQAMIQAEKKPMPQVIPEGGAATEEKNMPKMAGVTPGQTPKEGVLPQVSSETLVQNQTIAPKKEAVSSMVPMTGPKVNHEEMQLDRNSSGESLKKTAKVASSPSASVQAPLMAENLGQTAVPAGITAGAQVAAGASQKPAVKGEAKPVGKAPHPAQAAAAASSSSTKTENHPSSVESSLAGQLAGLNGQIEGMSEGNRGDARAETSAQGAPVNRLSGSDYLATMSGVRESKNPQADQKGAAGREISSEKSPRGAAEKADVNQASVPPQSAFPKINTVRALDPAQVGTQGAFVVSPIEATPAAPVKTEPRPPMSLKGNVVPGSWAQNRLTTESLVGVAGGIQNLRADGGGEIRIKLHPEDLGEIKLQVSTSGNRVGLKVQTHDIKARKILEESIQDLRDRLKDQNLTLHRVDFAVNNPLNSSEIQRMAHSDGLSQQAAFGDQSGNSSWQQQSSGRGSDARSNSDGYEAREQSSGRAPYSQGIARTASRAGTPSGRLDVVA